jgi:hypothetical protein
VAVVILHVHKYGKKVSSNFKSGGLYERHVVATWKLGTISTFACRHRETKKNLCRGGRSQDIPDTIF